MFTSREYLETDVYVWTDLQNQFKPSIPRIALVYNYLEKDKQNKKNQKERNFLIFSLEEIIEKFWKFYLEVVLGREQSKLQKLVDASCDFGELKKRIKETFISVGISDSDEVILELPGLPYVRITKSKEHRIIGKGGDVRESTLCLTFLNKSKEFHHKNHFDFEVCINKKAITEWGYVLIPSKFEKNEEEVTFFPKWKYPKTQKIEKNMYQGVCFKKLSKLLIFLTANPSYTKERLEELATIAWGDQSATHIVTINGVDINFRFFAKERSREALEQSDNLHTQRDEGGGLKFIYDEKFQSNHEVWYPNLSLEFLPSKSFNWQEEMLKIVRADGHILDLATLVDNLLRLDITVP